MEVLGPRGVCCCLEATAWAWLLSFCVSVLPLASRCQAALLTCASSIKGSSNLDGSFASDSPKRHI